MASTTLHEPPTDTVPTAQGGRGTADDATANAADTHSNDGSSVDNIGDKTRQGPVLNRRQKVQRHCGKFWLWYLVAGIIFLAILLPVLFTVIVPAIVQAIVKGQSIPVNGGALVVTSPNSLLMSLDTSIKAPLKVVLDPLNLYLSSGEKGSLPFLNVTLPKKTIDGNTDIKLVNQSVPITNVTELTKWFAGVFDTEKVDLHIKGQTSVHLGALSSKPKLEKTIKLPGLNKLNGLGIKELKVAFPPDENDKNIKGTLNLPNHGVLSLSFGNLTLSLYSSTLSIGFITINNVVLAPGNNTLPFDGRIYLDKIINNIGVVLTSQAAALNNGNLDLTVIGNSTIVNGEHIKFVEDVLNTRKLVVPVGLIQLLSDVLSGVLGGGKASIIDSLGTVFTNKTVMQDILSHWNTTKPAGNSKRASLRGAMAWNLLKMAVRASEAEA